MCYIQGLSSYIIINWRVTEGWKKRIFCVCSNFSYFLREQFVFGDW